MNKNLIKAMKPTNIVALSTLFWLIIFIISPLSVQIDLNLSAYILYVIATISLILGSLSFGNPKNIVIKYSYQKAKYIYYVSLLMAFIGVLFRFIDRFILRGIAIQNNFLENRTVMEEESGNIFAILSNILLPSIYIVIYFQFKYKIFNTFLSKLTLLFLFSFPILDSILLGSRSIIFIIFLFILFMVFNFGNIKISIKKLFQLGISIIGFFILMSSIFFERTSTFAGDAIYDLVLNDSNINYTITSNKEFKTSFDEKSDVMKSILFSYSVATQYIVHGMFEFSYLYSNFNDSDHTYGGYTFLVYKRFFQKLFNIPYNPNELYSKIPRTGIYTTLLGPLYIDFGWFSILFMFVFGRCYQFFYQNSLLGDDISVLMLFFFTLVVLFSPVFNFINGAGGIFLFTNFLITYLFFNIKLRIS